MVMLGRTELWGGGGWGVVSRRIWIDAGHDSGLRTPVYHAVGSDRARGRGQMGRAWGHLPPAESVFSASSRRRGARGLAE